MRGEWDAAMTVSHVFVRAAHDPVGLALTFFVFILAAAGVARRSMRQLDPVVDNVVVRASTTDGRVMLDTETSSNDLLCSSRG